MRCMLWTALAAAIAAFGGRVFAQDRAEIAAARGDAGAAPELKLHGDLPGAVPWQAESRHLLQWTTKGIPADVPVQIRFSTGNGAAETDVGSAPAGAGRFLWTVPEPARGCRLTFTAANTSAVTERFDVAPSQKVADYRWQLVTASAPFAPRDGAGALAYKDRLWLLGGWNPGDKKNFPRICNNEVWSSRDGLAWELVKPNTFLDAKFDPRSDWEGRHTAGYVVHKDRIWIVGGDCNQGHYHFDVWNSQDGARWTLVNPDAPVPWGPRALHYCAAFRDKIWVIGGQTVPGIAPADERFWHDVWTSEDGVDWIRIEMTRPYGPQRGMIGGSAVLHDRLWLLGGGTYDTPQRPKRNFYNDVWSTRDGAEWTLHTPAAPWEPRQYHEVAAYDGRLWVLEGYSGANRNDVWYSSDGVNWYELPGTPWAVRHAASVFVHDGSLWMVAGNNMKSDVWRLQRLAAPENGRSGPAVP